MSSEERHCNKYDWENGDLLGPYRTYQEVNTVGQNDLFQTDTENNLILPKGFRP